jgi:hypothetical protein
MGDFYECGRKMSVDKCPPDIWLVDDPRFFHRLYQIFGSGKISSLTYLIPLEQDYDLIGVIYIAEKMRPF